MSANIVSIGKALKNGSKVRSFTPSDNAELSSNGGHYAYATRYQKVNGGFEVTYWNSSDFEYCRNCGMFTRENCEPEVIDLKTAIDRLIDAQNHGDYIEVYSGNDWVTL